ncbi:hypothetical protein BANRA_05218 [Klebsiella pneumoniae]|nr:hypothetical protein BANRA_05218 [Klebsiella pneumoniae]
MPWRARSCPPRSGQKQEGSHRFAAFTQASARDSRTASATARTASSCPRALVQPLFQVQQLSRSSTVNSLTGMPVRRGRSAPCSPTSALPEAAPAPSPRRASSASLTSMRFPSSAAGRTACARPRNPVHAAAGAVRTPAPARPPAGRGRQLPRARRWSSKSIALSGRKRAVM